MLSSLHNHWFKPTMALNGFNGLSGPSQTSRDFYTDPEFKKTSKKTMEAVKRVTLAVRY